MSAIAALMPGETPVERAKEALRRCSLLIAFHTDMNPLDLYRQTKGSSEESYNRHLWIYISRVALDLSETDIAAALGRHHSTIQHACLQAETICQANPNAAEYVEWIGEQVIENFVRGRAVREALNAARESPATQKAMANMRKTAER